VAGVTPVEALLEEAEGLLPWFNPIERRNYRDWKAQIEAGADGDPVERIEDLVSRYRDG
jgi:hypothetical protein